MQTKEEIIKDFRKFLELKDDGRGVLEEHILEFWFFQLSQQKKDIDNLIAEEMLICHKEGQPTSRLTSLANKINQL